MSRKYHIWTIGCQMNEADSRHLGSQLESLGYDATATSEEADLVVLNTCVIRQQAEDKAVGNLHRLNHLKKSRPNLTIALMGCMVGRKEAPRLKEAFPFVDVFMPPSETEPLLNHLAAEGLFEEGLAVETREKAVRSAIQDEEHILPALQQTHTVTANVPVVLGCSHSCTFCIIPSRRGRERSKEGPTIVTEVRALADQGIKEVTLLGQIVDRYGVDFETPYDLADLLRAVSDVDGIERVRFLTSHPNYMTDKIIDTVGELDKVCPHFEIPSQAGNNEVLERMKRGYTIEQYEEVVAKIRGRIPEAAIHTDIIVGFPGETEEQFMDTYRHLERVRADKVHLAKYSERPRTVAQRNFPDDVTAEEKEDRRKRIDDLQAGVSEQKMARLKDQTVEVLVDGHDDKKGRWRGRTPQAKLVYFNDSRDLLGRTVRVKVDWTGPWSLIGKPVSETPAVPEAEPVCLG